MRFFVVLRAEPNNIKRPVVVRMMRLGLAATDKTWKHSENPFPDSVANYNMGGAAQSIKLPPFL